MPPISKLTTESLQAALNAGFLLWRNAECKFFLLWKDLESDFAFIILLALGRLTFWTDSRGAAQIYSLTNQCGRARSQLAPWEGFHSVCAEGAGHHKHSDSFNCGHNSSFNALVIQEPGKASEASSTLKTRYQNVTGFQTSFILYLLP